MYATQERRREEGLWIKGMKEEAAGSLMLAVTFP